MLEKIESKYRAILYFVKSLMNQVSKVRMLAIKFADYAISKLRKTLSGSIKTTKL